MVYALPVGTRSYKAIDLLGTGGVRLGGLLGMYFMTAVVVLVAK